MGGAPSLSGIPGGGNVGLPGGGGGTPGGNIRGGGGIAVLKGGGLNITWTAGGGPEKNLESTLNYFKNYAKWLLW